MLIVVSSTGHETPMSNPVQLLPVPVENADKYAIPRSEVDDHVRSAPKAIARPNLRAYQTKGRQKEGLRDHIINHAVSIFLEVRRKMK